MMDQHYYKLSFYSDIIWIVSKLQKYIYNIELIGRYRILKLIWQENSIIIFFRSDYEIFSIIPSGMNTNSLLGFYYLADVFAWPFLISRRVAFVWNIMACSGTNVIFLASSYVA